MRLGVVPYLNSFPLTYGLTTQVYREVPARLAAQAARDDIILAPLVSSFENPSWYLLDGMGIGSFGPVETVKLIFKNNNITIGNLKSIYLDQESKTSQALLKTLLKNFWNCPLEEILFSQKQDACDAALLIGDKIWNLPDPCSLDLGALWTEWTGLPFVYACWMSRSKAIALEWKKTLLGQAQKNLARLETLVFQAPPNQCPNLLGYWQRLKYVLDDESKKGIALFQKYWCELEGKPRLRLKWL